MRGGNKERNVNKAFREIKLNEHDRKENKKRVQWQEIDLFL